MAPSAMEKLVSERDSISDTFDRICRKLKTNATAALGKVTIQTLINETAEAKTDLKSVHTRIREQRPANDEMDKHKLTYFDLGDLADSLTNALHQLLVKYPSTPTPSGTGKSNSSMRLPKLELKPFSGNHLEWITFRDMFDASVNKSTDLSKIEKLTYLQSLVKGEASRQLHSMILSDSNYDIAWKSLNDRYQNPREIMFAVLDKFYRQKVQASPESLRDLQDAGNECTRSLEILGLVPSDTSNAIMAYNMIKKLDPTSRELWEQTLKGTDIPELKALYEFIEQRARALASTSDNKPQRPHHNENHKRALVHHGQPASNKCKVCNESYHPTFKCPKFLSLTVLERIETAKKHNMCLNCLTLGHFCSKCSSPGRCRTCNGKHHTLLHKPNEPNNGAEQLALAHHSNPSTDNCHGMLATAIIRVVGGDGQTHLCRAFLDAGATTSFISETCCHRLGLAKSRVTVPVSGLAAAPVGTARGMTSVTFGPHFKSTTKYIVNVLVLPKITGKLPTYPCDPSSWSHIKSIILADPNFHRPDDIDILLGSDIFWDLVQGGRKFGSPGTPMAVASTLGWLMAGSVKGKSQQVTVHHIDTLDEKLQRFWELESLSTVRSHTSEEIQCEEFYAAHHTRDVSGRYTVSLPLKEPRPALGSSRDTALRRFYQLERRLAKNPSHKEQYVEFMQEYLSLGHMSVVPAAEREHPVNPTYFIPHHFVLKAESTTTKFRVVFDASAVTTSGKSLNDCMMNGPVLQDSLVDLVTRFRVHPVAFTADIAKMYRQIRVSPSDADLQRILWREDPDKVICEYRLDTVTYGTASAPYLAVKTLQQLASDEAKSFPLASEISKRDFYVDDLMSSSESIEIAETLQQQLLGLMDRGGLQLRKWYSNSDHLLSKLPDELRGSKPDLEIMADPLIKTLGIRWNTQKDHFEFRFIDPSLVKVLFTKRIILSEISQLFDPQGWLSPIILRPKILMQTLWGIKADWDDKLPDPVQETWTDMKNDLQNIDQITIPRCMVPSRPEKIELVGFCDASEKAYGGVVYLRSIYKDRCHVSLVSSKTRVAPLKQICLPRLELCGAVLLSELLESVKNSIKIEVSKVTAWTDSTVTLHWIQSHPSKWKTFVANRVTAIQALVPSSCWSHVPGKDNPADLCSRGTTALELVNSQMWWSGPTWLQNPTSLGPECSKVPNTSEIEDMVLKEAKVPVAVHVTTIDISLDLITKYSSIRKLSRVTAYLIKFQKYWFHKKADRIKYLSDNPPSPLTPAEIQYALKIWIRLTQDKYFGIEIKCLQVDKPIPAKSQILSLNPFIDAEGLLRVGGRIKNAPIPQDQKTPFLIPRHSALTDLLISSTHLENSHAGPSLLLALLHQRYWILRGRDAVRLMVKKCVRCTKQAANTQQQVMGDLPMFRVTPCRAFQRCGIDYAGPFQIRPDLPRSKTTSKAYLALFVCFATRAFHLEVVSSLSTEAFLAALRRFVSRRGRPSDIHSDCGTNFVGANKELKQMLALVHSNKHNQECADSTANEGITWHFNPPGAPHFGGLWEAGVKSVKFHLNRIVGSSRLTFEELTTIMTQIEACLNSRPLTPLSSDPNDLVALTSGHFLIGEPLLAIPEPDLTSLNQNRLSRWQLLQSFRNQFWKRWSSEYLARLQQRPKWLNHKKDVEVGDLVIIKDENLPPQKWKLGRVIIVHPGADGVVRVTTLRTADGELKRPIAKLCLLPVQHSTSDTSASDCV